MPRADREEWAKRVQRWQESGLTAQEFASEMGLKPTSLSFWKWRLKKDQALAEKRRAQPLRKTAKSVRFVELGEPARAPLALTSPTEARIDVVIGDCTIRVVDGFDDATLRRLLDAIRERP